MTYVVKFTKQFKKDLKIAKKQGKDLEKVFTIINHLSVGGRLAKNYNDHFLGGKYKNCHECHIEPDWLLIYEYIDDVLILSLNRLGSHSKLFH